ncbi:hypothetical protein ON010_g4132 [Phytophthora cinnamomi]|nr:hypothetical protein ON010_g4132 [Phytophthora cinnamomi]
MTNATTTNEFGQPVGFAMKNWSPPPIPPYTTLTGQYCRLEPLTVSLIAKDLWDAQSEDPSGARWTYLPEGPFATFDEFESGFWMENTVATRSSTPLSSMDGQ